MHRVALPLSLVVGSLAARILFFISALKTFFSLGGTTLLVSVVDFIMDKSCATYDFSFRESRGF
jgi:hypothetical protein